MEQSLKNNLLACADTFAAKRNVKLTTLGRMAANDSPFFSRLRNDNRSSFTARKYDEIMSWFWKNWPDGVAWPPAVPLPINAPNSQAYDDTGGHAGGSSLGPISEIPQSLQPVDASTHGAAVAGDASSSANPDSRADPKRSAVS